MLKSKSKKRSAWIGSALVILLAIVGMIATNVAKLDAGQGSSTATGQIETTAAQSIDPSGDYGSAIAPLVRMVSALVIVIFAIYLGLYALKRMMGRRYRGTGAADTLMVIQSTPVGPKKSVTLVKVADKSVLVGVTEQNISILTELTEEETTRLLAAETVEAEPERFAKVLTQATGRLRQLRLKRGEAAA